MTKQDLLQVIRRDDIELGKPLPFSVYDSDRNLLLSRGVRVSSARQLDALLERGLYRAKSHHAMPQRTIQAEASQNPLADETEKKVELKSCDGFINLQDVKFVTGDTLQLQPMLEGAVDRYTVHVIGFIKPKSLLVTAPLAEGKLVFVRDGQTFLVRAFSGLNVYAFRAKVVKYQYLPFPYLHLSYPRRVHGKRVRKSMRAPASIIVSVHETADGKQIGAGRMVDISVGGGRVLSTCNFGKKDQFVWLAFKIRMGEMEEYVRTQAIIRAEGEELDDEGEPTRFFGFEFGELTQSQRLIIMNFVYHQVFIDGNDV